MALPPAHPLTWRELPEFDLLRALNRGLVPAHYDSAQYRRVGTVDVLPWQVFLEQLWAGEVV